MTIIAALAVGFVAGVIFTCWHYHRNTAALVHQAERVAVVFTTMDGMPVGPELQKLSKLAYLRRAL